MRCLTDDESVEGISAWFGQFGTTDTKYLRLHYARYIETLEFVFPCKDARAPQEILDVGAHWLHNAFFYANRGHHLIVMDAPDTLQRPAVKVAAEVMGAKIRPTRRMEKADGFADIPSDSVDIVLFCEVIEHLTFNPITFWKHIYRVLRPGGRIIVTTPNAFHYRSLNSFIRRMTSGEGLGLPVAKIFSGGTYGHHWKEFSLRELQSYFAILSPDFDTSRYKLTYHPGEENIAILGTLENAISQKVDVRAHNIFLDVVVSRKAEGIQIKPPWEPA